MDINTNNFWEKQNKIGQQKVAERAENIDKYGIHVPDDVYAEMNKVIANSDNPEDTAYRFGTAYQYSQMFNISFSEAYEKQDEFNKALFGVDASKSSRDAFTAVSDSFVIGKNNVRLGELGNALRYATTRGDEENLKLIEEEIKLLNEDNEFRNDNVPRMWVTEALKAGMQSVPFTAVGMVSGTFGNFISPGAGLIAGATTSANLMAGLEYLELRKNGASHDMANKFSVIMGGLEGIVEVALGKSLEALGAVGGVFGKKVIGEGIRREAIEKITNTVGKKLHYGATGKIATNIALRSVGGTLEEGLEEAVQELISIGGQSLAAELENYELPPEKADNIGKQVFESFKGGIMGSLVLGGLPVTINTVASVKDYQTIKNAAETIDSPEMFRKAAKESKEGQRVFSGFSDDKKDAVIDAVYKEAQAKREQNHQEAFDELKETYTYEEDVSITDEEGNEQEVQLEPEYRTESGELNTNNETFTDDGNVRGSFSVINEDGSQRYGHVDYTIDEENNTVTIDAFKMSNKNRDMLRSETFDAFAQNMAGYKIEWNPAYSKSQKFKEYLENSNPYGKNKGLNYYENVDQVADAKVRKSVDSQIKQNIPNMTMAERSAAIVLLEAGAKRQGLSLTEYVNNTFNDGQLFGSIEEAASLAQQTGQQKAFKEMKGAMTWKKFGRDTRAVIYASKYADFSTFSHELAHIWQGQLEGDLKTEAEKAFGVVNGDWEHTPYTFANGTVSTAEEAFARGFEDYLRTGKASNKNMKNIFQKFAEFLARVYGNLKNFIDMNPDIENVYNQLLDANDSMLKLAEKAVTEQAIQEKLKRQQEEELKQQQEKEAKKEADEIKAREVEESQEEFDETDIAPEFEEDVIENKEEQNVVTVEEEIQNDIQNSLGATDQETAENVSEVITNSDITINEKEKTGLDAAGQNRDDEIMIFQLAGVNGIRNMIEGSERKRRLDNLALAQSMFDSLKDLDPKIALRRIKLATGWDKNASGQWVYELDSSLFRIKNNQSFSTLIQNARKDLSRITNISLDSVLDAQELYEVYPFLKDVKVSFVYDKAEIRGTFHPEKGIVINSRYLTDVNTEKGLKGVLSHEIQHLIQAYEYAQEEGTTVKFDNSGFQKLFNALQQAKIFLSGNQVYNYDIAQFKETMNEYMNNEAEIDARNVARRVMLKANERKASILADTTDVDISQKLAYQTIGVEGAQRLDAAYETYERMDNYRLAREMELQGKDAKTIRLATGWERGTDALWRYEINDQEYKYDFTNKSIDYIKNNPRYTELYNKLESLDGDYFKLTEAEQKEFDSINDEIFNNYTNKNTVYLKDVLDAEELYNAYPEFKEYTVTFGYKPNHDYGGAFYEYRKHIDINMDISSGNQEEIFSILLHEIQHAIQYQENFAKGGNEKVARKAALKSVEYSFEDKQKSNWYTYYLREESAADFVLQSKRIQKNPELIKKTGYWQAHSWGVPKKGTKEYNDYLYDKIAGWQEETRKYIIGDAYGYGSLLDSLYSKSEEELKKIKARNQYQAKKYKDLYFKIYNLEKRKEKYSDLSDFELYKRLSGETESRNVQNRMYMSPEQRKETLLSETMDIAPEDQIVMFQTLVSAEKQAIDDIKKQYVNTDKWLKAPNGNDTNLTEKQWLQVRTPQFKAWFGDWENDPDNASKVVDENGEPLVVYHGTSERFDVFGKETREGENFHFGTKEQAELRVKDYIEFIEADINRKKEDVKNANSEISKFYLRNAILQLQKQLEGFKNPKFMAVYLNIKNPKREQDENLWYKKTKEAKPLGYDGFVYYNVYENTGDDSYAVFSPNQIKSATDNSGEFSSDNPSILFQAMKQEKDYQEKKYLTEQNLIKIKKGLIKTDKITDYLEEKLKSFGFNILRDCSGMSSSQYLTITNYKDITGNESQFNGDELKIRISNHDLPPSYDGLNGYHDYDIMSDNKFRGGNDGNATYYENLILNLYNEILPEQKSSIKEYQESIKKSNLLAKQILPEWLHSEEAIREKLKDVTDVNTRFLLATFANFDKKERQSKILESIISIKNNTNSSYYKSLVELGLINPNLTFQTAYHGTPHKFDRFSTSAIGTGEGNQSFGWGLYFTNQEDIARWYADKLTFGEERRTLLNKKEYLKTRKKALKDVENKDKYEARILKNIKNFNKELRAAEKQKDEKEIKFYKDLIISSEERLNEDYRQSVISSLKKDVENINAEIKDLEMALKEPKRQLYTVEIPDNNYLLWDKEYNVDEIKSLKQPLFDKLLNEYFGGDKESTQYEVDAIFYDGVTGEDLYHSIQHELGSDKAASLFLRDNGYIGIDYPANSFAGFTDEGKRNYVIFDENDVQIVNHLNFQTLEELYADARDFDSWQMFMEAYEGWLKPTPSLVPEGADASWYENIWNIAHGIQKIQDEGELPRDNDNVAQKSLDALFIAEIQKPGKLEEFLKNIHYLNTLNFDVLGAPLDEEDAMQRQIQEQLQYFMRKSLTHGSWFSNAARVFKDKPLTHKARQTMITLMNNAPRDYRDIYSELMGVKDFAVPKEEKLSTNIKLGLVGADGAITDILSPEKRKQIAEQIRNDEIAQKIKDGTLLMNEELESYIKKLEAETKEIEKKYQDLKEQTEADYKRLSDWQTRQLLAVQDELYKARARYELKSDDIARKIKRGIKLTSEYEKEERRLKADYDKLFKQYNDLISTQKLNAEVQEALTRKSSQYQFKQALYNKRDEKRLLEEVKKMRIQLVKRTMRRVPFNRVDFNAAKKLIAIQRIFEPNLFGGVNKWIGTEGAYLRGVWSSWLTDNEFREKITKRLMNYKSGPKVIELLDNTKTTEDFDKWTAKQRRNVHRLLPKQDWIKELKLEELAEERENSIQLGINLTDDVKYDENGKAYTLTRINLDDDVKNLVLDAIGQDLYDQLVYRPFAEWTTEEMEALAKRVDEIYTKGKQDLQAKKDLQLEEARKIREKIENAVRNTGIVINGDDTDEIKQKKQEQIAKILGEDISIKGTVEGKRDGLFGRLGKILHGYSDANVLRVARILDGQQEGVNVSELYRRENECYIAKNFAINDRTSKIEKAMKDNGIKLNDLFQSVTIENFYKNESVSFTIDELLFFLKAANDDKSKQAVMYGNMMSGSVMQKYKQEFILQDENAQTLDMVGEDLPGTHAYKEICEMLFNKVLEKAETLEKKYIDFANAISEDYKTQFDRLQEASIQEFNTPVWRENNYIPLVRLESNGDTNHNRVKEDLLGILGSGTNSKQWVNKGMTQKRIEISPLYQAPVETGLYKTWCDSVERTEHFIAYSGYVRELNRVYKSKDARFTRRFIEDRYGKGMLEYIDNYINEVANPNASAALSDMDRIVKVLRGRTAPAYLAWKTSSMIKQTLTSPWPFVQFMSPAKYLKACFEILGKKNMYNVIQSKSVFMKNRKIDPLIDLINEQVNKKTNPFMSGVNKFNQIGMAGLEMVDWMCVAPGWLAAYNDRYKALTEKNKNVYELTKAQLLDERDALDIVSTQRMTDEQIEAEAQSKVLSESDIEKFAVEYADDIVRQCQPSNRVTDLAPLFKQKGPGSEIIKAVLQFQTALNVIWQNIRYDLPFAVRQHNYKQIVGTVTGYAMAGIMMNAICEGFSDDEDDDELIALKKGIFYSTTQFTDAIPVIGNYVTRATEQLITGETPYSTNNDLFPLLTKYQQGTQQAMKGNWEKAVERYAEALGLTFGAPVSGVKEIIDIVSNEKDDGQLHFESLLGR